MIKTTSQIKHLLSAGDTKKISRSSQCDGRDKIQRCASRIHAESPRGAEDAVILVKDNGKLSRKRKLGKGDRIRGKMPCVCFGHVSLALSLVTIKLSLYKDYLCICLTPPPPNKLNS